MSTRVDVTLLPTLQAYGAFDISACFNCGNCTAICPLSTEDSTFPRRLIRYAQVGMRDELLGEQGDLVLLRVQRVLRDLPAPGRAQRVHGRGTSLRDRELRPDAPGTHHVPRIRSWARSSRWCWPPSSRSSCTRAMGHRTARRWPSSSSSRQRSSTTSASW